MSVLTYDEVYERVNALTELATLAGSITSILNVTRDPARSAKDLAVVVSRDPALTTKLIQTVNSCFYSLQRTVDTVEDAVVILGMAEVERLGIAVSLVHHFSSRSKVGKALNQLWTHSLVCGIVAETIVDVFKIHTEESPEVFFMAALLHDIGKAVIWQAFPYQARAILQIMEDENLPVHEAEREILGGATHCIIGAWASEQWNLPLSIVHTIQMHHTPQSAPGDGAFVKVIYLADAFCYEAGFPGTKLDSGTPPVHAPSKLLTNKTFIARFRERYESKRTMIETITK